MFEWFDNSLKTYEEALCLFVRKYALCKLICFYLIKYYVVNKMGDFLRDCYGLFFELSTICSFERLICCLSCFFYSNFFFLREIMVYGASDGVSKF